MGVALFSFTGSPERAGFIPAVCVCFTPPQLHNDLIGRLVKSANQPSGINPTRSSLSSFFQSCHSEKLATKNLCAEEILRCAQVTQKINGKNYFRRWGRREGEGISRRANRGFCRRQKTLSRREVPSPSRQNVLWFMEFVWPCSIPEASLYSTPRFY